jgi:hypothetical protein
MRGQFCPICGDPALEDSVFCTRHRAQAALFTQSFSPGDVRETVVAPKKKELAELGPLRAVLDDVWARTLERLQSGEVDTHRRAPELVIYYVREQLFARVYYSALPPSAPAGYSLRDPVVQTAVGQDGIVRNALFQAFAERQGRLRSGELCAVGIDFLPYEQTISVSERTTPDEKRLLRQFRREGPDFVPLAS